jgi:hypothetical protein
LCLCNNARPSSELAQRPNHPLTEARVHKQIMHPKRENGKGFRGANIEIVND